MTKRQEFRCFWRFLYLCDMRIEKIDLLEWGWHKVGDPSKPKSGLLWGNPDWPEFYIIYDEDEGTASVLHRYAKGGSDDYKHVQGLYTYMNTHKGYEHEWED